MKKREWEYGTRLKARLLVVANAPDKPGTRPKVVMLEDETGEGHIIAGVEHAIAPIVGTAVLIEFTEGGPYGGYFKILEEIEQK